MHGCASKESSCAMRGTTPASITAPMGGLRTAWERGSVWGVGGVGQKEGWAAERAAPRHAPTESSFRSRTVASSSVAGSCDASACASAGISSLVGSTNASGPESSAFAWYAAPRDSKICTASSRPLALAQHSAVQPPASVNPTLAPRASSHRRRLTSPTFAACISRVRR